MSQALLDELEDLVLRWEKGAVLLNDNPQKEEKFFKRFRELAKRAAEIVETLQLEGCPPEQYEPLLSRLIAA